MDDIMPTCPAIIFISCYTLWNLCDLRLTFSDLLQVIGRKFRGEGSAANSMLGSLAAQDPLIRTLDSSSDCEEQEKPLKQVNQYVLLRRLGEGSFAKVYLAFDTETRRPYALKRFKLKELQHIDAGVSQLEREISAMRKIIHENIIHLHDVLHVESTDTVYLVLDYADCGSLQDALDRVIPPDDSALKYIFSKVLSAVSYLHAHGIVHQDIKPSNILLCSNGDVFLSDFGVGHSFQSTAMVVGSPGYQAPEALSDSDWDPETLNPAEEDVWSLGITLYQCLFQRLPYIGENVFEIVQNIKNNPLVIPEGTESEIVDLLKGMLNVDPEKRVTIEDVADSQFFNDVPDRRPLLYSNNEDLSVNPRAEINHIRATVCDINYSFARPTLTTEELLRSKMPIGGRYADPAFSDMLFTRCCPFK